MLLMVLLIRKHTKCYTTTDAALTNKRHRGRGHSEASNEELKEDDEEMNEVVQNFQNLEEAKLNEK